MTKKVSTNSERGQAIVLIALAVVGLIAMIGLMIDGGAFFVDSSRLKRAVDAAAVSAALQYRDGYTDAELNDAARIYFAQSGRCIRYRCRGLRSKFGTP